MPAEKASIYCGAPLLAAFSDAPDLPRSSRCNWIAEAYRAVVADELRRIDWTRDEWCAAMDALNGAQMAGISESGVEWVGAWANLADAPHLGEKWGIDADDLTRRWRALTAAGRLAVYEVAIRFWSLPDQDTDDVLRDAGVRFAGA